MENKKMKKNLVFAFGILFFLAFTNFISAESQEVNYSYTYSYGGVQITSLKYEPYPANPGEYFDVWLKLNIGSSVRYAKVEFIESFPFSLDSGEETIREYDDFSGDVVLHYKIRVNDDAVEGTNELKFEVSSSKYSETTSVYSLEIEVSDAQTDFDLVVQDSTSSEISLAIANIGKNTANSMIVRIPEQESFKVTGTSGQMVGNLDSGDYTIVSFEVSQIGRNSDEPLLIQIDYTDSIGERRSVTKEIDFGLGSLIMNVSSDEMPEGFPENFEFGKGFPGQQKKAKWPYLLAVGLILVFVGFFVYGKYKRQIKKFFKDRKTEKEKSKEEKSNIPDWMIKEKVKERKR